MKNCGFSHLSSYPALTKKRSLQKKKTNAECGFKYSLACYLFLSFVKSGQSFHLADWLWTWLGCSSHVSDPLRLIYPSTHTDKNIFSIMTKIITYIIIMFRISFCKESIFHQLTETFGNIMFNQPNIFTWIGHVCLFRFTFHHRQLSYKKAIMLFCRVLSHRATSLFYCLVYITVHFASLFWFFCIVNIESVVKRQLCCSPHFAQFCCCILLRLNFRFVLSNFG